MSEVVESVGDYSGSGSQADGEVGEQFRRGRVQMGGGGRLEAGEPVAQIQAHYSIIDSGGRESGQLVPAAHSKAASRPGDISEE